MDQSSNPDLIKVTEIFLIPCSFLVSALGTADTNFHRASVSVIGLLVSSLWWTSTHEIFAERETLEPPPLKYPRRIRILYWLPVIFTVSWAISLIAHLMLVGKPLGE